MRHMVVNEAREVFPMNKKMMAALLAAVMLLGSCGAMAESAHVTPAPVQQADRIENALNPAHPEGFDNISLLTHDTYTAGAKASIRCSFEGLGCPEIILVEKPEDCPDGAVRYGACFELVLYKNGLNIWRHYREDGKCFWHKRLGVEFPVAEKEQHTLEMEVKDQMLFVWVDGMKMSLRTEDLFDKFHVGLTLCEGIAHAYSLTIEG